MKLSTRLRGPALASAILFALGVSPAMAFSISFDWSGLKLCTSGSPNIVGNPKFVVKDVPAGTAQIEFRMTDLDVPSYPHGGGRVAYAGGGVVAAGQFQYKSPCPPSGSHTYRWTATAYDKAGKAIGTASADKKYP